MCYFDLDFDQGGKAPKPQTEIEMYHFGQPRNSVLRSSFVPLYLRLP